MSRQHTLDAEWVSMEEEVVYLRLVIKRLKKEFPHARLSKKLMRQLRMKARARIEFEYGLHELNQQ